MNIQLALKEAQELLTSKSDSARLDAEVLLAYVLHKKRSYLYTYPEQILTQKQYQQFQSLCHMREAFHPIAYLIGEKEFWSYRFKTSPSTLIPRNATESLIDFVLSEFQQDSLKVLDLGTGTGAIAITLAKERPHWSITAVDIKASAIALAKTNAKELKVTNCQLICSSWFNKLPLQKFDLIISNPPYIHPDDSHLNQGDVQHEPRSALVSADSGFADLKYIIDESAKHLSTSGSLILEHGYDQQNQLIEYFKAHHWSFYQGFSDADHIPRFCVARL